jgi:hypothetical protein
VERAAKEAHVCDPTRRLDYQLATGSVFAEFDAGLREFLDGNEGRFEEWLAAREVRRAG